MSAKDHDPGIDDQVQVRAAELEIVLCLKLEVTIFITGDRAIPYSPLGLIGAHERYQDM